MASSSESSKIEKSTHPRRSKRKTMSLERLMIMFTLFFFGGVLLLVVIPEEHVLRGIAMTVYSIAMFWAMYRYGV